MADGRVVISILADDKEYMAKIQALNSKTNQAVGTMGNALAGAGKALTMGLTAPLAAAGVAVTKVAADFESSMNEVKAATGAGGNEMKQLEQLAIDLGASTKYSANEAAQAMIALAKGGLEPAQIKAGALESALNLATVGEMGLAQAADLTVQTMGMFGIKAENAHQVTTALAGAAAKSTADVSDLAQGLQQAGASASSIGWSLNETTAVLAAFADQGIRGSDAGTSLKTMMMRLTPQTDKAAAEMERFGLSFADANGNMDDAATVAGKLQAALGGLSAAERNKALATMFGSDAQRAAIVLMNAGSETIKDYIAATKDQAYATELANAKMKGAKGAVEEAAGAIETAAISFGKRLLPAVEKAAEAVGAFFEWLAKLTPAQKDLVISLAATTAAIGPMTIAIGKMVKGFSAARAGYAAFLTGLKGVEKLSGSTANAVGHLLGRALGMHNTAMQAATAATVANATATTAAGGATKSLTAATIAQTVAQKALNVVMKANPWAIAAGLIVALGAAMVTAAAASEMFSDKQERLTSKSQEQADSIAKLEDEYKRVAEAQGESSDAALELKANIEMQKAAFDSTKETLSEYSDRLSDTIKHHQEVKEEIGKLGDDANLQAGKVLYFANQIQEIGKSSKDSASKSAELRSAVAGLNESMGGASFAFDRVTGGLTDMTTGANISRDALDDLAKSAAKQIQGAAAVEAYNKALDESAALSVELVEAQANLTRAKEEDAKHNFELTDTLRLVNGEWQVMNQQTYDLTQKVAELDSQQKQNLQTLQETQKIKEEYEAQQERINGVLDQAVQLYENEASTQEFSTLAKQANVEATDLWLAAQQKSQEMQEARLQQEQELAAQIDENTAKLMSYAESSDGFSEAISNSGMTLGEFAQALQNNGVELDDYIGKVDEYKSAIISANDEIKANTDITYESIASTTKANTDIVGEYTAEMAKLMSTNSFRGKDEVVKYFQQLGPEGLSALKEVNGDVDGKMKELGDIMADAAKAATERANTELGMMPEGATQAIAGANEAVATEASKMPEAIAAGIKANANQVDTALSSVGDNAVNTLSNKKGQMKEAGANVTQGAAEGIKSKEGEVKQSTTQVADAANRSMNDARPKYQQTGQDLMQSAADGIESKNSMVSGNSRAVAIEAANAASNEHGAFYNAGQNLGQGMADGIASKSGAIESAARNAAIRAYNAAQRALDSHSPSRKGRWLGGTFSQGLALGIKDDAYMLEDETVRAIKNAEQAAKNASFKAPLLGAPELRGYSVAGVSNKPQTTAQGGTTVNVNIASFNNFDTKRDSKQVTRILNAELSRMRTVGQV